MTTFNEDNWATQIKATLNQAQPNAAVRADLAARRNAVLQGAPQRAGALSWLGEHRFASVAACAVLLLTVFSMWPKPEARLEQYAANTLTAQVVDEVLYDSLDR